jgi:hypothetical protein
MRRGKIKLIKGKEWWVVDELIKVKRVRDKIGGYKND